MGVVEEGRSPSKLIKGDLPHKGISVFKRGHNPLQVLLSIISLLDNTEIFTDVGNRTAFGNFNLSGTQVIDDLFRGKAFLWLGTTEQTTFSQIGNKVTWD